jgi:hypothetical protein
VVHFEFKIYVISPHWDFSQAIYPAGGIKNLKWPAIFEPGSFKKNITVILYQALLLISLFVGAVSCGNKAASSQDTYIDEPVVVANKTVKKFKGAFSNGMKGDSIFFTVSADQKKLMDLTFKGYWRCNGKLEMLPAAGPEGSFTIAGGKVEGSISEPPGGGSTSWRFELDARIDEEKASGSFRMNINNLGCDSYKLNFSAVAE